MSGSSGSSPVTDQAGRNGSDELATIKDVVSDLAERADQFEQLLSSASHVARRPEFVFARFPVAVWDSANGVAHRQRPVLSTPEARS